MGSTRYSLEDRGILSRGRHLSGLSHLTVRRCHVIGCMSLLRVILGQIVWILWHSLWGDAWPRLSDIGANHLMDSFLLKMASTSAWWVSKLVPHGHISSIVGSLLIGWSVVAFLSKNLLALLIVVMMHWMVNRGLVSRFLLLILVKWHTCLGGISTNGLVVFVLPELVLIWNARFSWLASWSVAGHLPHLSHSFACSSSGSYFHLLITHRICLAMHSKTPFLRCVFELLILPTCLVLASHIFKTAHSRSFLAG